MDIKTNRTIDMAIRNAEASLRMEGLYPSRDVLRNCRRVLSGELSHEQYISDLRRKYMGCEYDKNRTRHDS
jgi:hypothetical protein